MPIHESETLHENFVIPSEARDLQFPERRRRVFWRTKSKTDFKRLRHLRDADIDNSDVPALDKSFWKHAKLTMPEPKDRLTPCRPRRRAMAQKGRQRLQTRINAILRSDTKAQSE